VSKPTRKARPRFWFDPRFAIGLILVFAAVSGVYAVVAGSDRTMVVYAARSALAVGDRIGTADLAVAHVRLDSADDLYLTPARFPGDGVVVTRTIAAGELVPASAVGRTSEASLTSVVVELSSPLATAIGPGSVVDVWSARQSEHARFDPPVVLVGRAAVVRILEPTGLVAANGRRSVEVLVPKASVAAVLEAIANADAIAVVPVNEPLGK
jgi:hypothetical protein